MQRSTRLIAAVTRPRLFNLLFRRFNSTVDSLINQINSLPIYNINKLSNIEFNSWENLTSSILHIISKSNKKPSDTQEDSAVYSEEDIQSITLSDYVKLLHALSDRGFNDNNVLGHYISNLQNKVVSVRKLVLLSDLLLFLSRANVKANYLIRVCTESLEREMDARIGPVFLDREHIQIFITNLLRYIHTTGHNDFPLYQALFDVIIDGYSHVPPGILSDMLYNLAACYPLNSESIDKMSYEEKLNTPKQHFLTPIARHVHSLDLGPIDKAKVFRSYILFDFHHTSFTNRVLNEVTEALNKSTDYEYFDHFAKEYLPGFNIPSENYTFGQILIVADSLLLSRKHHSSKYHKDLVQSIYYCLQRHSIDKLDPIELRCAMTIIANSKNIIPDQEILSKLTIGMVNHLECARVCMSDLAIFLKDLVRCTKLLLISKNQRNRTIRTIKYNKMSWIAEAADEDKSLLERISNKLTIKCDIANLTHCLRSIAYLGFDSHTYYSEFISHFKANIDKLPARSIAHIEQTFNKIKLKDGHLFYLLGKRFQQIQLESPNKLKNYIRRIG